jgi:hypothetical protein
VAVLAVEHVGKHSCVQAFGGKPKGKKPVLRRRIWDDNILVYRKRYGTGVGIEILAHG